MKIILSFLLLASCSVFAANDNEILNDKEIINALSVELQNVNFTCSGAYGLQTLISVLDKYKKESGSIRISNSKTAPFITVNGQDSANYRWTFKFYTPADMKSVDSVTFTYQAVTVVKKNVGTLIKPKWEDSVTVNSESLTKCTSPSARQ